MILRTANTIVSSMSSIGNERNRRVTAYARREPDLGKYVSSLGDCDPLPNCRDHIIECLFPTADPEFGSDAWRFSRITEAILCQLGLEFDRPCQPALSLARSSNP